MKNKISLMIISQFIIIACLEMTDPYWPLIIQHMNTHLSASAVQYWSAAIYIVPALLTLLTAPLWSQLGERYGHKKMVLRATTAIMLTQILISSTTHPLLILIIRLIQGCFAGFVAATSTWLIAMSHEKTHSHIMGRVQSTIAIGSMLGPVVGGLIANHYSYRAIFVISGMSCALVLLVLSIYLPETPRKQQHLKNSRVSFLSFLKLDNHAYLLLMMICLTQMAHWMSSSYFALYVTQQLQGSNLTVGILYAATATMIFLSALRWGRFIDRNIGNRYCLMWLFIVNLVTACLMKIVFAYSVSMFTAFIAAITLGVALGAISVLPFSILIKYARADEKAKLVGFGNSALKLGNILGVTVGAFIQAEMGSFTISFLAVAFVYLILIVFVEKTVSNRNTIEASIAAG